MRILSTFLFVSIFAIGLQAQKFGYINSQLLLSQSPEIKSADAKLGAFQNKLISEGEKMVADFEAKYKSYVDLANSGTLSQIEIQEKESVLAQAQQDIQEYEVQVQTQIIKKREELYKPILDSIKNVLDTYAKANGYTMVFDSGAGALLHALPGDDLMDAMKLELGF